MPSEPNMKKTGAVEALNMSPKGFCEGFLLRTAKGTVQINFPKDEAEALGRTFHPGDEIAIEVEPQNPHGEPQHKVFRLVNDNRFSGRVVQLNYALHGEVNGGILDSGDFLHLKPEGARAVGLATGMEVEGRGVRKPMTGNRSVIEAEVVNGVKIRHGGAKKKHAAKHAGH
jgi:hypothetical protein